MRSHVAIDLASVHTYICNYVLHMLVVLYTFCMGAILLYWWICYAEKFTPRRKELKSSFHCLFFAETAFAIDKSFTLQTSSPQGVFFYLLRFMIAILTFISKELNKNFVLKICCMDNEWIINTNTYACSMDTLPIHFPYHYDDC